MSNLISHQNIVDDKPVGDKSALRSRNGGIQECLHAVGDELGHNFVGDIAKGDQLEVGYLL